jgi:hypothetical protein
MIIILILNVIVLIVGVIFSWLPLVDTLPTIFGYDIDNALVVGMGYTNVFFETFWPLAILFQGFLILMFYYMIKMTLRPFLGHRAPPHGNNN